MKRNTYCILFLSFLVFSFLPTSIWAQDGTLSVSTTPVSATIYVDGARKGAGSWSGSMPDGSYTVSFGQAIGYNTPSDQTVTITAGQTVTVIGTYTLQSDRIVLNARTDKDYLSLQAAYDDPETEDGDVILIQAVVLTGNLVLDRSISVTFQGGYNSDFAYIIGETTINGDVPISDGTNMLENIIIQ